MNFMVAEPDCTVADLSALQHFWTEAQYLTLTNHSHRLIEFTDGCIEILPVPAYPTTPGDFAVPVPGIGRRRSRQWRELRKAGDPRCRDDYWIGADLVMEVVSPDDPYRDLVEKRIDYAEAGIPEYWIVNPIDDTVTVLVLGDGEYREHGVFRPGAHADSPSLPGISISVTEVRRLGTGRGE